MKRKNKIPNGILVVSLILLIGVVFYFGVLNTEFNTSQQTLYESYSVDYKAKTITFASTSTDDLRAHAFKSQHAYYDIMNTYHFDQVKKARGDNFWKLTLEANGINSDDYELSSTRRTDSIFVHKDWKDYATKSWDESDNAYKYTLQDGSVLPNHNKVIALGYVWDYRGTYHGGYSASMMNDLKNRMVCYVEGKTTVVSHEIYLKSDRTEAFVTNYKIWGDVAWNAGLFTCNVDVAEFKKLLPATYTQPGGVTRAVTTAGVNGRVVFIVDGTKPSPTPIQEPVVEADPVTPGEEDTPDEEVVTFYRDENEICSAVTILPQNKLANDYTTLNSCLNKTEEVTESDNFLWRILAGIGILVLIFGSIFLLRRLRK